MSASAPEAPPFSDTTIGCFIRLFFWTASCIMRAIWSEAPPAPAATTISTGFVGSHAATAGAAAKPSAATAAAMSPRRRILDGILTLLIVIGTTVNSIELPPGESYQPSRIPLPDRAHPGAHGPHAGTGSVKPAHLSSRR